MHSLPRLALLFSLLPAAFANPTVRTALLPAGADTLAIRIDSAGDIYVAGSLPALTPLDRSDAFVARFTNRGQRLVYLTRLAGSSDDQAVALAVNDHGEVFVTGTSSSPDFPLSANPIRAFTGTQSAFVTKLDALGNVISSTFFTGADSSSAASIALTRTGDILVSGRAAAGQFLATADAARDNSSGSFVAKLNASASAVSFILRGVGGGPLALDTQGNIFVATPGGSSLVTPGALQGTPAIAACGGGGLLGLPCPNQHVAKIDPSGTSLIFATFLNGNKGASTSALVTDASGNVYVAGTSNSPDYPVTAGAAHTVYRAAPSPEEQAALTGSNAIVPPASTGFVTKLDPQGRLVFSTLIGGSRADSVTDAMLINGAIYITGRMNSPDFTGVSGLPGIPAQCARQFYMARLSTDGSRVDRVSTLDSPMAESARESRTLGARIAMGADEAAYVAGQGSYLVGVNPNLFEVNARTGRGWVGCVTDGADGQITQTVTPGQVLTIWGPRLSTTLTASATWSELGTLPRILGVASISIDGQAVPLLYASVTQINFVAPYEIAGKKEITLAFLENTGPSSSTRDSLRLFVAPRAPAPFLWLDAPLACRAGVGPTYAAVETPLVLNADSAINSCNQPAAPGSIATLFLNGGGDTAQHPPTGEIVRQPTSVNVPIEVRWGDRLLDVVSATLDPGSVAGVWRVRFRVPPDAGNRIALRAYVDGVPIPNAFLFWAMPNR